MRVRAVRSFVWHGPRDVDVGETLDVDDRDGFLLCTAYGYCTPMAGETPPESPVSMTVSDPQPRRRR